MRNGRKISTPLSNSKGLIAGLSAAVVIAAVAQVAGLGLPAWVSPVVIAVVLGAGIANVKTSERRREQLKPGASFAGNILLKSGIVLLGAQVSISEFTDIGVPVLLIVFTCFLLTISLVVSFGRLFGVPRKTTLLIGVGMAICGNTAIMATAPIIRARMRDVSYAVGTITLLGTASLIALPLVAHMLDMDASVFGVWAGAAINDTSQVVGAGSAYSAESRDVATVVKLFRNTLLAPALLVVALYMVRAHATAREDGRVMSGVLKAFPKFVLGFIFLAALRSGGVIPDSVAEMASVVALGLITIAIAGVGLNTDLSAIRQVGTRPLVMGIITAVALSVVALLLSFAFVA